MPEACELLKMIQSGFIIAAFRNLGSFFPEDISMYPATSFSTLNETIVLIYSPAERKHMLLKIGLSIFGTVVL